jgi:hypothetical protein
VAISPVALDHYLNASIPMLPEFKHADAGSLYRSIYDSTGQLFDPKTEPRQYQLEGIAFGLYLRRALLLYDMRLGKTLMALTWAEHLKRARLWRGKGLVIAHSPLGLQVWEHEVEKHSRLKIKLVHTDPNDFVDGLEDDSDLIVIPVSGMQELFSVAGKSNKGKKKLYPNMSLLTDMASMFELCVIDEIHMYKDHTSLRFQITAALTVDCHFRLGLTGTPIGRDPFAYWAQTFLIDRGETLGHNYYFFEQAFGIGKKNYWSGRMDYAFDRKKLPILHHKLSSLVMNYRRDEVTDQTVWNSTIDLRMYGDQLAAYHDVINKLVKLGDGQQVEILHSFHRLRQVSSGYLIFDGDDEKKHTVHFKANPKLEWLSDLVMSDPGVQVVIFHEYTHTGELICEMLAKHKVTYGWLYGGVTSLVKSNKLVADFQSGQTQYLVANSAKGGMSIDLPQADYLVFYESPVSPITRQQAEARPMARKDRPLMVDDMIASPVERRIAEYLTEGRDILKALVRERRHFGHASTAPCASPGSRVAAAPRRRVPAS